MPPLYAGRKTFEEDELDGPEPSGRFPVLEPPRIVHESPGCLMATWKNISIVVWGTQGTVALVHQFASLSAELARAWPGKLSTIHLIVNDAPLPAGDARAQLAALAKQYQDRLVCALTVLSGTGFWSSAMRGFITSLHWLTQPRYNALVCKSTEEGAAWLPILHTRETGVYLERVGLKRMLDELRARVPPE